ncbi:hypothetical protein Chor_005366 [Crotalus horridus]
MPPPPPPGAPPGVPGGAPGPGAVVAAGGAKSGEERLKEMEAEMALFEQEVLGAPVSLPPVASVIEAVPVALAVPAVSSVPPVPVIRPIIATNTYQQLFPHNVPPFFDQPLCLMSYSGQVGPGIPVGPLAPLVPVPRPVVAPPKVNPTVIQAAPTVYSSPPVKKQEEEHREPLPPVVEEKEAAGTEEPVIGPSMPETDLLPVVESRLPSLRGHDLAPTRGKRPRGPDAGFVPVEPVMESTPEDKKKTKQEKLKRCIRTAAGTCWEDPSLLEWDPGEHPTRAGQWVDSGRFSVVLRPCIIHPSFLDDFRIFCGDLGNEVNDDILARAFSRYPSFLKAKVIRDKRTGKTKGYGFVSFKDPNDYVRAMREMNGKYVGSRPIKLRKSMWKDRNIDIVRKKQKEKKKLGLR